MNDERRSPAQAALDLYPSLVATGLRLIVLGTVLAHAFDFDDWMLWRRIRPSGGRLRSFYGDAPGSIVAASLPTPTEKNTWWADPGNAARARSFCRATMKER